MRRSVGCAVLVLSPVLAGCSDGPSTSAREVEPSVSAAISTASILVYLADTRAEQDAGAAMPYGVVGVPVRNDATAASSDRERITAAVDALLQQRRGRHENLWAGRCAPGSKVSDVRIKSAQVTVVLDGSPAADCDVDQAMTALQAQQLAWTVVENSDVSSEAVIAWVDGTGRVSDRWTADPAMLIDD